MVQDWSEGVGYQVVIGATIGVRLVAGDNSCVRSTQVGHYVQFNKEGKQVGVICDISNESIYPRMHYPKRGMLLNWG